MNLLGTGCTCVHICIYTYVYLYTHMYIYMYIQMYTYTQICTYCQQLTLLVMSEESARYKSVHICVYGVALVTLYVSFAKEPYKRDDILQKRPII